MFLFKSKRAKQLKKALWMKIFYHFPIFFIKQVSKQRKGRKGTDTMAMPTNHVSEPWWEKIRRNWQMSKWQLNMEQQHSKSTPKRKNHVRYLHPCWTPMPTNHVSEPWWEKIRRNWQMSKWQLNMEQQHSKSTPKRKNHVRYLHPCWTHGDK